MIKSIRVLVWKDSLGLNWPSGKYVDLPCAHINEGVWGVNMSGEVIPAATSTVPVSETGTDFQKATIGIPAGNAYPSATHFTDASFKACVKVKDLTSNNVLYVDETSYLAAIDTCNDCCTPTACVAPAPDVTAGPTSTTATVSWTAIPKAVGYEYVVVEEAGECVDPTAPGTFVDEVSVALTGLTAETTYCFAVRTICGAGRYSDWAFVQFTTLA